MENLRVMRKTVLPIEFNITPYFASWWKYNFRLGHPLEWRQFLEDQDQWRMSGIHREVYLMAEPKIRITDFFCQTKLDKDYEDAILSIRAEG